MTILDTFLKEFRTEIKQFYIPYIAFPFALYNGSSTIGGFLTCDSYAVRNWLITVEYEKNNWLTGVRHTTFIVNGP